MVLEASPPLDSDREIGLGQDPRRRPLEQVQLPNLWGDLRNDLNRARTGADKADAPTTQLVARVPPCRVKHPSSERVEPRNLRERRRGQWTRGCDHHPRGVPRAEARLDRPGPAALVEAHRAHALPESEVRSESVALHAALQIREDLCPGSEGAGPRRVGLERQRVQVGLHVTCGTGIVVVAPGSTDSIGLFEKQEVVDARSLEADGHSEPREARSDDDHLLALPAHRTGTRETSTSSALAKRCLSRLSKARGPPVGTPLSRSSFIRSRIASRSRTLSRS